VDTESIIDQARREDNPGNRIRYIRETLFDQMGIQDKDEFFLEHAFTWRNTRRTCEILFGNIRTLSETAFVPNGENWKLIIDYPFDEPNRGPMDDLSKLQEVQAVNSTGLRTVAWVPSFFSLQSQKNLGLLVVLEHVLTGERFPQYAVHLSRQDQAAARALLENQRSQLRQRVKDDLCAVYGLDAGNPEAVDSAHELTDHFQSLWSGFDPQPPARTQLRDAMEDILGQALAYQFPAHPLFEAEIKTANLNKVLDVATQAARTHDGRIPVDKSLRQVVRQIANPLLLGEIAETHFVLGQHWKTHFNRKAAETGGTQDVGRLRQWIDQPSPMGLPEEAADLVILVYAEQTNRSFYFYEAPYEAALKNLKNDLVLREQTLPAEPVW